MQTQLVAESETQLISQAQAGNREAFGELVRCFHSGVVNVVFRMCGDAALAEDAAQTAFIQAWRHLAGYQPRTSFRSWLYRIAVNAALDVLRQNRPTIGLDDVALNPDTERVEARVEERERRDLVKRAVLSLPEASRAVLVLREYEGMSYQEIAAALEIPVGTVMSRLNYARTRLAEWLSPYLEDV